MVTVVLGAGFSAPAGVPLASQLFDAKPEVDRITRRRMVDRVLDQWARWHSSEAGTPEQYLAYLQQTGSKAWLDAQWYVGLVIALSMGRVEIVGGQPKVTRHNLDRTTGVPAHEAFWTAIFRHTEEVSVVTTNYDVLPERGIRHKPRPRVPRPGFHYGDGPESLAGGGYPSYSHIQKITASGTVPIYKLHGSVSWSCQGSKLVRYHDCRPAIRGDAAIVAPVTAKSLPRYLEPSWRAAESALRSSRLWLVVGYSLPEYDHLVRGLLQRSASRELAVHVFDPDESVLERLQALLPARHVQPHPGLPQGIPDLEVLMDEVARTAA